MLSAHLKVCKFAVLALGLASLFIQGCALLLSSSIKAVPVEEADQHGISFDRIRSLKPGDTTELVMAVLGAPADRRRSCVLDGVIWRYPIRAWSDIASRREIVPAILLRIRFDKSGTLIDWGFVDAIDGHSLTIKETASNAHQWFQSLSQAPPPTPPYIDLNKTLIRGQTTQPEVEKLLGRWHPDLYCGNGGPVPLFNNAITEYGSVWNWYADRPSPLFVPPRYLVVSYDKHGSLTGWHFETTYPGGRK